MVKHTQTIRWHQAANFCLMAIFCLVLIHGVLEVPSLASLWVLEDIEVCGSY